MKWFRGSRPFLTFTFARTVTPAASIVGSACFCCAILSIICLMLAEPGLAQNPPVCDVTCTPSGGTYNAAARPTVANVRGSQSKVFAVAVGAADTTIETGNATYNSAIPILHLPGRSGFDLDLTLYYNPAVWTFDTNAPNGPPTITFNADRDSPSYGFRLDFGYMELSYDSLGTPYYVLIFGPCGAGTGPRNKGSSVAFIQRLSR